MCILKMASYFPSSSPKEEENDFNQSWLTTRGWLRYGEKEDKMWGRLLQFTIK